MKNRKWMKEPKAYEGYYEFPFPPEEKEPVVIDKEDTITEIYPPDQPFSSNIVWVWASTDLLTQTMLQISPGAFFEPPDTHAGDEMYYVLKGTLTEIQPELGQVIRAEKGEAILIPKGSFHQSYNFGEEATTVLCAIAPRMWDEEGPAPTMEKEPKLYKTEGGIQTPADTEDVKELGDLKLGKRIKSIDHLGEWPIDGETAREKKYHVKISKEDRLDVIHGRKHPMKVDFIVSNDLIHMANMILPSGGEGPRTSELETHKGDETLYVTKGPITLFFPEIPNSMDVPEGSVALIPEGIKHRYQNFNDHKVEGIFTVAPDL